MIINGVRYDKVLLVGGDVIQEQWYFRADPTKIKLDKTTLTGIVPLNHLDRYYRRDNSNYATIQKRLETAIETASDNLKAAWNSYQAVVDTLYKAQEELKEFERVN